MFRKTFCSIVDTFCYLLLKFVKIEAFFSLFFFSLSQKQLQFTLGSVPLKEFIINLFHLIMSSISKFSKVEKSENEQNCQKIMFFYFSSLWVLTVSKTIDCKIGNTPWFQIIRKSLIYKKKNWLRQIEISQNKRGKYTSLWTDLSQ